MEGCHARFNYHQKENAMKKTVLVVWVLLALLSLSVSAYADNEAVTFSVTVPARLPVVVGTDGSVSVASDARIINNSSGAVKLDAASVVPQNSWLLDTWGTDYRKTPVGSRRFSILLCGNPVPANGAADTSGLSSIPPGGALELDYDVQLAVQKANISQTIAKVVFTVSWEHHGPLTGISVAALPEKTAYEAGENFDSTGLAVAAAYADGTKAVITGWTVTDGETLTEGQTSVTISYTESGITRNVSVPITVASAVPLPVYAILYTDGGLVFQQGDSPEPGRTVAAIYSGVEEVNATQNNQVPWADKRDTIQTVTFKATVAPVSTAYWFNGCYRLTTLEEIEHLDTSQTISMRSMFESSGITSLDLSSLDTSSVRDMRSMFDSCDSLVSLIVAGWDTSQVTDMHALFSACESLKSLDLSDWNTGRVEDMGFMFDECYALSRLDLTGWSTTAVTTMANMFGDCHALTTLDLSGFDTSAVTNMSYMFYKCRKLTTLYASDRFVTGSVTSSGLMFSGCTVLVGGNGTKFNKNNTNATYARIDSTANPGYFTSKAVSQAAKTVMIASGNPNGSSAGEDTWLTSDAAGEWILENGEIQPRESFVSDLAGKTNERDLAGRKETVNEEDSVKPEDVTEE